MTIGWTQNVVILEAELTPQEQTWYIKATGQFGWSKLELQRRITDKAHLEIVLDFTEKVCYTEAKNDITEYTSNDKDPLYLPRQYMQESDGGVCNEGSGEESKTGEGFPDCLRCHQHRGDWTPGLSSSTPQAGRAWDTVRWTQRPPTDQSGLRRVRPPDRNGSTNLRSMYRICGGDYAGKMHLLLDFTDRRKGTPRKPSEAGCAGRGEARERSEFSPQAETEKSGLCFDEVADPWYTDDFEATWQDVLAGCQGLLKQLWESR